MKRVNLFLATLATIVVLSVGFSSCGGGSNSSSSSEASSNEDTNKDNITANDITIVKTEASSISGYDVYVKNTSDKILNGTLFLRIYYNDGSSETEERPFSNFHPGEVQNRGFSIYMDRGGLKSFNFIDK
jgi:hypothetical protein